MFWLSLLSLLFFLFFLSPSFIVSPAFHVLLTETHGESILDSGMRIKDILLEIAPLPLSSYVNSVLVMYLRGAENNNDNFSEI